MSRISTKEKNRTDKNSKQGTLEPAILACKIQLLHFQEFCDVVVII